MIANFQLAPRVCKFHNLPEEFICVSKQCQYRSLLCATCTRQNHYNHLHDIRSIPAFIDEFKQKTNKFEQKLQKDKVVINVKEITQNKLHQLDQLVNEIIFNTVKLLEQERTLIKNRILEIQNHYEQMEKQFEDNLQARYIMLDYLSAYKNCPKALQARIITSSDWGIISLKNTLNDMEKLSNQHSRNANEIISIIVKQAETALKETNFLYKMKDYLLENQLRPFYDGQIGFNHNVSNNNISNNKIGNNNVRKDRITSFAEKSYISTNVNGTDISIPKQSPVAPKQPLAFNESIVVIQRERQRARTNSLSSMNMYRPVSQKNVDTQRIPSIDRMAYKNCGDYYMEKNNKLVRGLKKLNVGDVIIR